MSLLSSKRVGFFFVQNEYTFFSTCFLISLYHFINEKKQKKKTKQKKRTKKKEEEEIIIERKFFSSSSSSHKKTLIHFVWECTRP